MIYAAEIQYYDIGTASVKTYYVATEGFTSKPTDTPANTVFHPRVVNPAILRRDIFDLGTVGGASRVGYGELVLSNEDGGLDVFTGRPVDGLTLTIRCADDRPAAYPAGWTTVFTCTMDQPEVTMETTKLSARDRQVFASAAFQPNKYGGTNVLPNGVDGIESDIKGKPLPMVLGAPVNCEPVCVNTSLLIYQIHDGVHFGTLRDIRAVYDSGVLLNHGTDYTDQADMEANAPAAGEFRVWLGGGMFRLGSSATGTVTCDPVKGLTPMERTAGFLFSDTLSNAGVSSGNISAADVAALDVANPATLGIYVRNETTNAAVLEEITRTVGAWWASDVLGVLRIQRLEPASGSPVLTITEAMIVEDTLKRLPLNDNGLPTRRVLVRAIPNYTVQAPSSLATSVTEARRARLAQPYQDADSSDPTVLTAHPLAPELTVEARFACLTDGQTEADRLQAMRGTQRDRYELKIKLDAAVMAAIDLGVVVTLMTDQTSRFGFSAGVLARVLGYEPNPLADEMSLTLWI